MNVEDNSFFIKMVDELVEFSEHDKELNDGIKYIDKQAQEKGISFYEMIYAILFQHDMNQRVNDFINEHTNHANIYKSTKQTGMNEKNNDQNNEGI